MQYIPAGLSLRIPCITGARARLGLGLAWLMLVTGLGLRLMHYLNNRSLWFDEALLARNILDRGPWDLLRPLDYNQGAPVLFLLLVDAATGLLGPSELPLRLVPLLASLAGLLLFFLIALHSSDKRSLPTQLCLFSYSYHLVYYAQEAKQYAVDVAVALALSYAFLRVVTAERTTKTPLAVLGVSGSLALWLSHSAAFILAGIGIALLVHIGHDKRAVSLRCLAGVWALWLCSFGTHYVYVLKTLTANALLHAYWQGGFLPAPTSMSAIKIWVASGLAFLGYAGYPLYWIMFIVVALVAVAIGDAIYHRRPDSLSWFLPFVFALVASALYQYPFRGRLILFLLPFLYLLMGRGLQILTAQRGRLASLLLITVLLVPSFSSAHRLWTRPIFREEVRPVLMYLRDHLQPHDQVYIYRDAAQAVQYYQWYVRLPEPNVHWGLAARQEQAQFRQEIDHLQQWPRVWFLFSHLTTADETSLLSQIPGERVSQYQAPGASVYLYHFAERGANVTVPAGVGHAK